MRFTKMRDRTDEELKDTLGQAFTAIGAVRLSSVAFGSDQDLFWKICAGVDAYFEQRRRKEQASSYGEVKFTAVDPKSPAFDDMAAGGKDKPST